jgi:hypothetical protein
MLGTDTFQLCTSQQCHVAVEEMTPVSSPCGTCSRALGTSLVLLPVSLETKTRPCAQLSCSDRYGRLRGDPTNRTSCMARCRAATDRDVYGLPVVDTRSAWRDLCTASLTLSLWLRTGAMIPACWPYESLLVTNRPSASRGRELSFCRQSQNPPVDLPAMIGSLADRRRIDPRLGCPTLHDPDTIHASGSPRKSALP